MRPLAAAEWRRILLEAAVIVALAAVIGLSLHWRLLAAFERDEPRGAAATASPADWPVPVGLAEVQLLLTHGAVAVDARPRPAWEEGHLPGALPLALGDFAAQIEPFQVRVPTGATVVVYCSGSGCPDSFDLARRLLQSGYQDVRVFEGGYPEWRDAALPVTRGAP